MVKNNRCLAMAYIDARLIQDRLDDVLGAENWEDAYKILPDGSVMCRLTAETRRPLDYQNGRRLTERTARQRRPIESRSERCTETRAVKFGIGRYLYRLPAAWVDYDPVKKQIVQPPALPAFAIPQASEAPSGFVATPQTPKTETPKPEAPKPEASKIKKHHKSKRLKTKETPKAGGGRSSTAKPSGEWSGTAPAVARLRREALGSEVVSNGCAVSARYASRGKGGYTANMSDWTGAAIPFAVDTVKEFEQSLRQSKPEPRTAA